MSTEQIPTAEPVVTQTPPVQTQAASGQAVAALILGILSILCMGIFTGIPAIVLGSIELKAIKAGKAPQSGEGMAKVGYILGIIGTVFTCLAALAAVAIAILGVSLGTSEALKNVVFSV